MLKERQKSQTYEQQIGITRIYDEDGESYFVLPSGYDSTHILVNESPTDLRVRHISEKELEELKNSYWKL